MAVSALFMSVLRKGFDLNTRRDYILKPLGLFVVINALFFMIEIQLVGEIQGSIRNKLLLYGAMSLPFVIGTFGVLTYLFRVQSGLAHLAMTDELTGLANRRSFIEQTKAAFVAGRSGYFLLIDADHFKQINDTYGHAVGDICLKALAAHLQKSVQPGDIIGRIGGEEFAAYLPDGQKPRLVRLGKHLTRTIPIPVEDQQKPIHVTLSIGATDTSPLETVETAMQRADLALYHAKKTGRARMVVGPRPHVDDAA